MKPDTYVHSVLKIVVYTMHEVAVTIGINHPLRALCFLKSAFLYDIVWLYLRL